LAALSTAKLEALRGWLKTQRTTAMVVVVGGRLVFEYGDTKFVSKVASVCKSILAMLYGIPAVQERVDFNKTVVELGLDDVQPFLPGEKNATLMQLLTARSGIYHPSGNDELTSRSPRRDAQIPGLYGPPRSPHASQGRLERQAAPENGLDRLHHHSHHASHSEIHPLELSLPSHLYGRWGYGVLWWVWDAPVNTGVVTGPYQGAYAAIGTGGQYIVVFPASDAVVVHKVDIDSDEGRKVSPDEFSAILQMVITSDLRPMQLIITSADEKLVRLRKVRPGNRRSVYYSACDVSGTSPPAQLLPKRSATRCQPHTELSRRLM
jgi:CubicO group peptidase (beta-lactamase class C family)